MTDCELVCTLYRLGYEYHYVLIRMHLLTGFTRIVFTKRFAQRADYCDFENLMCPSDSDTKLPFKMVKQKILN